MRKLYPYGPSSFKGNKLLPLEVELDIDYVYHPPELMTRNYPGTPAEIDVLDMKIYGMAIPDTMLDNIMEEHEDEIKELCMEDFKEKSAEIEIARKYG